MRENLSAVESAPLKCDMRKFIRFAPTHLVGDEGVEPCLPRDLRQTRRKAEGVRQIEKALFSSAAKVFRPVVRAVQNLTHEALA